MEFLEWIRSHALALPNLAKFAFAMAIIVGVPRLSQRVKLPAVVGLLLSGVVIGPHVLGVFPVHAPIADFLADLGKLLLMFFAGLEIDLALFRRARNRSIIFGLLTTSFPLVLGAGVGCGSDTRPSRPSYWDHCWPRIRYWHSRSSGNSTRPSSNRSRLR